jgi:hypothetical protein
MIIWGTKVRRRRVGYVADHCAVCHEPRLFELIRVGIAGHLYFVSLTQGKLAGHEIRCCGCGLRVPTEQGKYDGVLHGADETDVQTAIQRTQPHLGESEEDKKRIAFDRRLLAGRLTADERHRAIGMPFYLLEPDLALQKRERRWSPIGRKVGWVVAALTVPILVLLAFTDRGGSPRVNWLFVPFCVAWLAGLFTIPYFIFTCMRSFIRRELEPRLARALAPLDPTLEELDSVYRELREAKYAIARKTKPHRVLELIAKLRHREK